MIPILFPSDATNFTTQGLGALSAAISCTVTEERNGMYELELVYPMIGVHFAEIQDRCQIYAIPSPYRDPQPFRIYRHTKPMGGKVTFYAQHISYDLLGIPLNPCSAGSAAAAMVALQGNAAIPSPFSFWTDKSTVAEWSVKVPSASRSVLGGQTGSILDVYGGEYEWDGYTVKLHQERGRDNGVVIRYGKNLNDLEQDRNVSNVVTGIYPYWNDINGENLVVCDPPIIQAPGTYDFTRVIPVDFSADFDEAPTPEQLKARAETYVVANQIGVPKVSITVSFIPLEQAMGYEDLRLLEKVDLCDTVTVQYEALGVDAKAKVIRIETDVLRERYNEVELGDAKCTLADTIINQSQEIQQRPTQSDLQQAITNATKWITNGKGYMVPIFDGAGNWSELCSLDQQSLTEAQNVWRWNNGGFGHSSDGYNGPYRTAITQDGHINADFVDIGTLVANIIKTGVLSSKDGKTFVLDLDAGTLDMMASSLTIKGKTVEEIAQGSVGLDEIGGRNYILGSDVTYHLTNQSEIPLDVDLGVVDFSELEGKTATLSIFVDGGGLGYTGDPPFGAKAVVTWRSLGTGETIDVDYFPDLYDNSGVIDSGRSHATAEILPPEGYDKMTGMKVVVSSHMKPSSTRFSFTLSRPKLEMGSIPTDWTPAPEDTAEEIQDAIDGQTQEDIFNKLTNNGQLQGLYMQDGKLYINATYLATGIIKSTNGASKWDLNSGVVIFSNQKTYKHTDYTDVDSERITNILVGTVTPTEADFEKYDIYKDGKITGTDRILVRNMMNDKQNLTVKWECKFSSATPGKLISVTVTNMSTGKSYTIFELGNQNRISLQSGENLSNTGLLDYIYPVGSIYMSVNSNNPGMVFGGSWVPWGTGRVPVGVDTGDGSFNTVEKTGGEKTHKLTTNEMPSHGHQTNITLGNRTQSGSGIWAAAPGEVDSTWVGYAGGVGGSAAHNNLQPYITCYMWKRTA